MKYKIRRISFMYFLIFPLIFCVGCGRWSSTGDEKVASDKPVVIDTLHQKKEVVIMVYHRFGDQRYPSTNISIESFRSHLNYLKKNEFTVMTLGQAIDYVQDPAIQYKNKVAVITIDDGYRSFMSGALPLLKEYGYGATIFINSESVGGGDYMSWDELASIMKSGIEIGNHSHSHPYFVDYPEKVRIEKFKEDVGICQEQIKKHLGIIPDLFAYPYGEFDLSMKKAIKEMGFIGAAAQNSGVLYAGKDVFSIPRFPMAGPFVNMQGFIEKINMHPLRTLEEVPVSFIVEENPPVLKLLIKKDNFNVSQLQCFIQRENCIKSVKEGETSLRIELKAEKPLKARRTLYTITIPGNDMGQWFWYSHLWIRPNVKE